MSQVFIDDCYASTHQAQTDLQSFEDNFAALKSSFSGPNAPSNPIAGMWWLDTTAHILKQRNEVNNAWLSVWDMANNKPLLTNILVGDIPAAMKDAAAATPSLRTLGTTALKAAPGDDVRFTQHGMQHFISSGTFVVPADVVQVFITLVSGGGGGGGGAGGGGFAGGAGGGGGKCCFQFPITVTPLASYAITIGAGGAGGGAGGSNENGGAGGAGGATSFGALLSLSGSGSGNGGAGGPTDGGAADGGNSTFSGACGGGGGVAGGGVGGGGSNFGCGGGGGGGGTPNGGTGGVGKAGCLVVSW